MSEINVGDVMDLYTDPPFTNADGDVADPDIVRCLVRRAGLAPRVFTYAVDDELTRESEGIYHCRFEIASAGTYYYRWEGAPDPQAAEENSFTASSRF